MSAATILVVDDDPQIREVLSVALDRAGFRTVTARDGAEGLARAQSARPDLAVLDIGLPEMDGLALCRAIRADSELPILFLTARDDEVDRILGLEMGGDDYVTKPFSPRELLARVKNLIRRKRSDQTRRHKQRSKSFSGWTLDLSRRCLSSDTKDKLPLTRGEFELLVTFLEHPGKTLHREWLMEKVTHRVWSANERTIDVLVLRLRNKIEQNSHAPQIILTVHGEGYLFASEVF